MERPISERQGLAALDAAKVRILAGQHVIPALGARKLRELSAEDVDRWLAEKARTLSTRAVQELRSILLRSVKRAQARDKVRRNVVLLCGTPTGQAGRPSRALAAEGWLRVGLADGSTIRPVIRELNHTATRGRGMQLVAAIADRWDSEDYRGGKRVWFDLSAGPT